MFIALPLVLLASLLAGTAVATGPREECNEIWNVLHPGQTCQTISQGVGVSIDWMLAHNPDLVCNGQPLALNTRVCTGTYTATCYAWETATAQTCATDPMLAQWSLTKDKFVELNDNVDEDSCALTLGQDYCVTDNWCAANVEECCSYFPEQSFCPGSSRV